MKCAPSNANRTGEHYDEATEQIKPSPVTVSNKLHSHLRSDRNVSLSKRGLISSWVVSCILTEHVTVICNADKLMSCLQETLCLQTRPCTHWMPPVSTCYRWTAAAAARPQTLSWMPRTWDTYVFRLQLKDARQRQVKRHFLRMWWNLLSPDCANEHLVYKSIM